MYCSKCGNKIKEEEQFCSKCGNKIENTVKEIIKEENSNINVNAVEMKSEQQLNSKRMKKVKNFIIVLTSIIITIVLFVAIQKSNEKAEEYAAEKAVEEFKNSDSDFADSEVAQKLVRATATANQSAKSSTSLIGRHNIVYYNGFDISDYRGYLDLKSDNTFKMYLKSSCIDMDIINIEGTYKISGKEITLNVTKEGGFDVSSQSRKEIITIAEDNLVYNEIKFAR